MLGRMKRLATWVGGLLLVGTLVLVLGARRDHPAGDVEARWAQPPSRFVVVDGLRVHYRDRGRGPAIVLLHGSLASLFTWEGWATELEHDHRVVTIDLPGHGLTGPDAQKRYSPRAMAAFLDRFAAELGLLRFSLGGNSMGGAIAWRYAILHPDKIARLILVDADGQPREEPRPLVTRLYRSPLWGPLVRWISPRFMVEKSVHDVYGDPRRVSAAVVAQYDDMLLRAGNREAAHQRLSLVEDDGLLAASAKSACRR